MSSFSPALPNCAKTIERIEAGQPLPVHLRGGVVALGNFDGFHLGHQALIRRAIKAARLRGVAAIVATFDPHPVRYFRPEIPPFCLTTIEQRQQLAQDMGADALMVFRFDGSLASTSPEHFVANWLSEMGAIVTGSDFSYGRDRLGDVHSLASFAKGRGLVSYAVPPVLLSDRIVSSTRIREALRSGNCATAARLLGRPYAIEGALHLSGGVERNNAAVPFGDYLHPKAGIYQVRLLRSDGCLGDGFARVTHADAQEPNGALLLLLDSSPRWVEGERVQVLFHAETQE